METKVDSEQGRKWNRLKETNGKKNCICPRNRIENTRANKTGSRHTGATTGLGTDPDPTGMSENGWIHLSNSYFKDTIFIGTQSRPTCSWLGSRGITFANWQKNGWKIHIYCNIFFFLWRGILDFFFALFCFPKGFQWASILCRFSVFRLYWSVFRLVEGSVSHLTFIIMVRFLFHFHFFFYISR